MVLFGQLACKLQLRHVGALYQVQKLTLVHLVAHGLLEINTSKFQARCTGLARNP